MLAGNHIATSAVFLWYLKEKRKKKMTNVQQKENTKYTLQSISGNQIGLNSSLGNIKHRDNKCSEQGLTSELLAMVGATPSVQTVIPPAP